MLKNKDNKLNKEMFNNILKDLDANDILKSKNNPLTNDNKNKISLNKLNDNDESLLVSMTKRVTELEKLVNAQRLEIKEKVNTISTLNTELNKYKSMVDSDTKNRILALEEELEKVKNRNKEMESFLKQYGLIYNDVKDSDKILFNHDNINKMQNEYFENKSK